MGRGAMAYALEIIATLAVGGVPVDSPARRPRCSSVSASESGPVSPSQCQRESCNHRGTVIRCAHCAGGSATSAGTATCNQGRGCTPSVPPPAPVGHGRAVARSPIDVGASIDHVPLPAWPSAMPGSDRSWPGSTCHPGFPIHSDRRRPAPPCPRRRVIVSLLDRVPGIGERVAKSLIAEIGADMDQFPDQHHLAVILLRLCAGSR